MAGAGSARCRRRTYDTCPIWAHGGDRDRADRAHAVARRRRAGARDHLRAAVRRRRRRTALPGPEAMKEWLKLDHALEPPGLRRQLGSPALFGIVQGFIAASIYFS